MAIKDGLRSTARAAGMIALALLTTALAPAGALAAPSTERVSVSSLGAQAASFSGSFSPSVSADGRYVAFASAAPNLVPGDTNGVSDVFVHDRQTAVTQRVSVTSAGSQLQESSASPSMTPDGRFVAFSSHVLPDPEFPDNHGPSDVSVHDRQSAVTSAVIPSILSPRLPA